MAPFLLQERDLSWFRLSNYLKTPSPAFHFASCYVFIWCVPHILECSFIQLFIQISSSSPFLLPQTSFTQLCWNTGPRRPNHFSMLFYKAQPGSFCRNEFLCLVCYQSFVPTCSVCSSQPGIICFSLPPRRHCSNRNACFHSHTSIRALLFQYHRTKSVPFSGMGYHHSFSTLRSVC